MTEHATPNAAPAYLSTVTRLRRARRGNTIHRADCPRAGNTLPWIWAESRTDDVVRRSAQENGLRLCRVCQPACADA